MKQHPATTPATDSAAARPTPRYVTDREVARRYDISRACVWRWAAEGVIPRPVKLAANTSRWDVRELDRFEAERAERAA